MEEIESQAVEQQAAEPFGAKFDKVYRSELEEIKRRRKQLYKEESITSTADENCPPENLVGLALSGGGIRSATFCLGFLQGLHKRQLLRVFDYLSTVSGGGYVGGWWSAWLAREETSDKKKRRENFFPPREKIEPQRQEEEQERQPKQAEEGGSKIVDGSMSAGKDPIHHLRLFANYLTPRRGLLSADTWRAVSVITRNLALTWLIILPIMTAAMLIGQIYFIFHPLTRQDFILPYDPTLPQHSYLWQRLFAVGDFFAVFGAVLVVIVVFWLISDRVRPSWTDKLIHIVCLTGMIVLIVSVASLYGVSGAKAFIRSHPISVPICLVMALFLLVYIFYPLNVKYAPSGDEKVIGRWKQEVRRSRLNFVHTKIMVTMFCLGAVFLFSGFAYELVEYVLTSKPNITSLSLKSLSLLPVLSAIAGAIFTAVKTNSSSSDKRETHEPSAFSRFVFAVTPILVIIVLAVGVAWMSRRLFLFMGGESFKTTTKVEENIKSSPVKPDDRTADMTSLAALNPEILQSQRDESAVSAKTSSTDTTHSQTPPTTRSNKTVSYNPVRTLYPVVWFLCIWICLTLAIYEMEPVKRSSKDVSWWKLPAFISLFIFNLSWSARVIYASQSQEWSLLLPACVLFALINGFIALRHILFHDQPIKTIYGNFRSSLRGQKKEWLLRPLRVLLPLIAGIAPWIDFAWLSGAKLATNPTTNALQLQLAGLAGVLLFFRLTLVRVKKPALIKGKESVVRFDLAFFKENAIGRSPDRVWLLGALYLTLAVALACWSHAGLFLVNPDPKHPALEITKLISLPIIMGILIIGLFLFRIAVGKMKSEKKSLSHKVFGKNHIIVGEVEDEKIGTDKPWLSWKHIRISVAGLVGICVVAGFATNRASTGAMVMQQQSLFLPSLSLSVVAGVILFAFASPQVVLESGYPGPVLLSRIGLQNWVGDHPERFLLMLAVACAALGVFVGFLADSSLKHLQEMAPNPRAAIILPFMFTCFTISVFETFWGGDNNRRALGLLAATYSTLLILFALTAKYEYILTATSYKSADEFFFYVELYVVSGLIAALLLWVMTLGWMVDPNGVSMHDFYRARLVRAYLGASNERRCEAKKEISESVEGDDLLLSSLKNCERGAPYHIINTTLNLVAGRDLATAQRSASSFVLTQEYCGSTRTNYRPTKQYMDGQLTLGTAIAASGAAVSPNMGSKKPTAALAMLMTFLNVRLGFWAPTPKKGHWKMSQPKLWPFYLMREFLSQTTDLSSYCYLTDGGHFDNTGLYSLVERGCRYIVVVDCSADPQPCFQDLGDAIRRCRIDFGTEIKLCLSPLIKTKKKRSKTYFAVGEIWYSREHAEMLSRYSDQREKELGCTDNVPDEYNQTDESYRKGVIIYFKPSIIGEETPDVRQYAIENKHFPQQTTANQWFDEAQFESYRRLGQLCAKTAFGDLAVVKKIEDMGDQDVISIKLIKRIFLEAKRKFNPEEVKLPHNTELKKS